ncbi:MAG: class I SAM-dependent methyltransferase [Promethearchaeota archaeon]
MNKAFGDSLLAYWRGNLEAKHIIERDDGYKQEMLVEYLFKNHNEWPLEKVRSLEHIPSGSTILDVGCGVGRIAIYLQKKGHKVVGLDSCPTAFQIAKARGLQYTFLGNIFELKNSPIFDSFDTI